MTQVVIPSSLYDRDYALWLEDTVYRLRTGDLSGLDVKNLVEELEDLGRSQRRELKNRLRELVEHLLKRSYIPSHVLMAECYRGWVESIDKQRMGLRDLLEDSPSLKPLLLEMFDGVHRDALKILRRAYPLQLFPDRWPFRRDLDALLNADLWLELGDGDRVE